MQIRGTEWNALSQRLLPCSGCAKGFTLLELLTALAIVAIVLSIAIPGYNHSVTKTRRHDAELALQSLALAMRRYYAMGYSYRGAANGGADTGEPEIFPAFVPLEGNSKYYRLSITIADDTKFELKAIPIAPYRDELCGALTLNSHGERGSNNNDGHCWNGSIAYQGF